MKRLFLLFGFITLLYSCEYQDNGVTSIDDVIKSQYLIDGIANNDLDEYVQNNEVFRFKGKPELVEIPIGNNNLSEFESCFVLYVSSGTIPGTAVSSAIISLDGMEILRTSDFSENAGLYTFEVCNLTPTSMIKIEVRGEPGTYVNMWIEGRLKIPPVFYYSFEGNLNDNSGNNHYGTPEGTPVFAPGPSGRGQAASFNGNWRFIVNNSTPSGISLRGNWTMAFSIYPQSNFLSGNGFIQRFYRNECTPDWQIAYGIYIFDDDFGIKAVNGYVENNGPDDHTSYPTASFLNYNSWNRFIFVHKEDQTADIYLNGVKIYSSIICDVGEESSKQLSVGGNYINDGCYGPLFANYVTLDDLILLDYAASDFEISNDNLESPLGSE